MFEVKVLQDVFQVKLGSVRKKLTSYQKSYRLLNQEVYYFQMQSFAIVLQNRCS